MAMPIGDAQLRRCQDSMLYQQQYSINGHLMTSIPRLQHHEGFATSQNPSQTTAVQPNLVTLIGSIERSHRVRCACPQSYVLGKVNVLVLVGVADQHKESGYIFVGPKVTTT